MVLLTTVLGKARNHTANFQELIDGTYFTLTELASLQLAIIPSLLTFLLLYQA